MEGIGSYNHPENGRKYYLDKATGNKAVKDNQRETAHVDVHHMFDGKNINRDKQIPSDSQLKQAKKKYPLGENLYVPK